MAIRKRTLEENSVEHIVLLNGNQTFIEAEKLLKDKNLPENDTYVVVELPNKEYNVIRFSDLKVLSEKKANYSTQPLPALPIPQASRVVTTDTTESGREILDWVAIHPQSTIVVTDAGKVVGLFTNPNRSGGSELFNSNISPLGSELFNSNMSLPGEPTTPPPPPERDI